MWGEGGGEWGGGGGASSFAQVDQGVPVARSGVEFGEAVGEPWRGARPTLPDSLPMIGAAPWHSGLWLAFGNQHIGFTTGPATGAAIAAMISGTPPPFNASPFSPGRYLACPTQGKRQARSTRSPPCPTFGASQ